MKADHPGSGDLSAAFNAISKGRDEAGLSRLLMAMALSDLASNPYAKDAGDALETVAKRYRVNTTNIRESATADFAAKRKRRDRERPAAKNTAASSKRGKRAAS
ncbi:MAG TPA: hypothetical protein VG675_05120 [Bryobacteraceae bacterium]|nr:hypothetical protein [Bryobacteraceae bacterium]